MGNCQDGNCQDDWCHVHGFFESSAKNRRGEEAEQNTEQRT